MPQIRAAAAGFPLGCAIFHSGVANVLLALQLRVEDRGERGASPRGTVGRRLGLFRAAKAIGVTKRVGLQALQVIGLPESQAVPGEVRIRVHAATVSPTDALLRIDGHAVRMPGRRPPFVPYLPHVDDVTSAGEFGEPAVGGAPASRTVERCRVLLRRR